MVLLWASAGLSAIVDNIPYVATMSPIVAELVNADGGIGKAQVLWWALALGADLGGNATAVGASANVVVLGIAERAGHQITFWEFTKYGLIVTVITVALAVPYLWLRFFAFDRSGAEHPVEQPVQGDRAGHHPVAVDDRDQRHVRAGHHRGDLQQGGVGADRRQLRPVAGQQVRDGAVADARRG